MTRDTDNREGRPAHIKQFSDTMWTALEMKAKEWKQRNPLTQKNKKPKWPYAIMGTVKQLMDKKISI